MAATNHLQDIKTLLEKKQLCIGLTRTLKGLKTGKIAKVYVAANAPKEAKADISYYTSLGGTEMVDLEQPNVELGVACRKPFPISVIGVLKEKNA